MRIVRNYEGEYRIQTDDHQDDKATYQTEWAARCYYNLCQAIKYDRVPIMIKIKLCLFRTLDWVEMRPVIGFFLASVIGLVFGITVGLR